MTRPEGDCSMKKVVHAGLIFLAGLIIAPVAFGPDSATAAVTGACYNCHTMHNSQDNAAPDAPNGTAGGSPQNFLLRGGCIGCHSGATDVTDATSGAPVVYRTGSAPALSSGSTTTYLAGGDFYWVANTSFDDEYGHNVAEVTTSDALIGYTPPGWTNNSAFAASDTTQVAAAASTWGTNQLTCDGVYGCHGTHTSAGVNGGHHGDDSTIDGSTVAKSYRFLIGIKGTEDADWEKTYSTTDHNGYFGEARSAGTVSLKTTISFLCAQCHGNFHSSDGDSIGVDGGSTFQSAWVRHPVDVDLQAKGGEYASYTDYDPLVPVANTTGAVISSTVQTAGNGLVTCISCHRAHGSPYKDMLRWDYSKMLAGTAATADKGTGCFKCHSSKDDGVIGY